MKKLFIVALAFCSVSLLHAQLNKGQWLVGGSAGFSTSSYDAGNVSDKGTKVQLSPGVGYFVFNKLALGLRAAINYSHDVEKFGVPTNNFDTKSSGLGLTPYVRYYFLPKANRINLLADVSYSDINTKLTTLVSDLPNSSVTTNQHALTFAAGPAFFIDRHVALEITAAYEMVTYAGISQNVFLLNGGFQIHL